MKFIKYIVVTAALAAGMAGMAPSANASTPPHSGRVHAMRVPLSSLPAGAQRDVRAVGRAAQAGTYFGDPQVYSYPTPAPPYAGSPMTTYIEGDSQTYLHLGNAAATLAYAAWCYTGNPYCSVEGIARLGSNGYGHNMFPGPATYYVRDSNTGVWPMVYWFRPDNRTYCWFYTKMIGTDWNGSSLGTEQLQWGCGPYAGYTGAP